MTNSCDWLHCGRSGKVRKTLPSTWGQTMWRSILAVILLPSLTAAQAEIPITPQSIDSKVGVPCGTSHPKQMYHSYTRLNRIRRGMTEDVAIELAATEYVAWPAHSALGVLPMNLEIEPAEGFTVKNFRFP